MLSPSLTFSPFSFYLLAEDFNHLLYNNDKTNLNFSPFTSYRHCNFRLNNGTEETKTSIDLLTFLSLYEAFQASSEVWDFRPSSFKELNSTLNSKLPENLQDETNIRSHELFAVNFFFPAFISTYSEMKNKPEAAQFFHSHYLPVARFCNFSPFSLSTMFDCRFQLPSFFWALHKHSSTCFFQGSQAFNLLNLRKTLPYFSSRFFPLHLQRLISYEMDEISSSEEMEDSAY